MLPGRNGYPDPGLTSASCREGAHTQHRVEKGRILSKGKGWRENMVSVHHRWMQFQLSRVRK